MAQRTKAPFDRVPDGYDPNQVASFASEALTWKRDLAKAKSELSRFEALIGEIDTVEREAAEVVDNANREATEIVAAAHTQASEIIEKAESEGARLVAEAQTVAFTPVATPEPTDDPSSTFDPSDGQPLAVPDTNEPFEPSDESLPTASAETPEPVFLRTRSTMLLHSASPSEPDSTHGSQMPLVGRLMSMSLLTRNPISPRSTPRGGPSRTMTPRQTPLRSPTVGPSNNRARM